MQLMEAIYARRSVRVYTGEPVPRAKIERLLQAAVQAPTAMNSQPWAFGVIEGAERLKDLSDRTRGLLLDHLDELPSLERFRDSFANPNFNIFYGAPAVIVIFAKDGPTADTDCMLAAENLMLAATDMGLGTCWMGFFHFFLNTPEMRAELGIPEGYKAVAPLAVGTPRQEMPAVEKAEPEVVFWV